MSLEATKTSGGGGDFELAPQGLHRAVCVDVVDRGEIEGFKGRPTHKIDLIWQLEVLEEDGKTEVRDGQDKRFQVLKRYTFSLHEKANLCKDLESWRGKPFDEGEKFDVETLIGVNCQLQIGHYIKDGGNTKASVQAIVQAAKNGEPLKPENYIRWKDREKKNGNA